MRHTKINTEGSCISGLLGIYFGKKVVTLKYYEKAPTLGTFRVRHRGRLNLTYFRK
eukprot:UN21215